MKKLSTGIFIGLIIGVIATELFYTYLVEKSEELSILVQYKHLNSYILNSGNNEAIENQLNTWLNFLDTYKPNKYSTLPTSESVNIERAATYYQLAIIEENLNTEKYNTLMDNAKKYCEKTAKDAKCTKEMIKTISCVVNIFSNNENCKPNKALNRTLNPWLEYYFLSFAIISISSHYLSLSMGLGPVSYNVSGLK